MTKAKLIKKEGKTNLNAIFVAIDTGRVYNFHITRQDYEGLKVNEYYFLFSEGEYSWIYYSKVAEGKLISFREWNYKEYDCTQRNFECHICIKDERTDYYRKPFTYSGKIFNYREGIDYTNEIIKNGFIKGTTL